VRALEDFILDEPGVCGLIRMKRREERGTMLTQSGNFYADEVPQWP
jgi:hypothetical protein